VPSTTVTTCPVCLLPGCRGHVAPARPVCACARPMLMDSNASSADDRREELNCLKCGRPRPGAYRG
jgi:hypothetical protein